MVRYQGGRGRFCCSKKRFFSFFKAAVRAQRAPKIGKKFFDHIQKFCIRQIFLFVFLSKSKKNFHFGIHPNRTLGSFFFYDQQIDQKSAPLLYFLPQSVLENSISPKISFYRRKNGNKNLSDLLNC